MSNREIARLLRDVDERWTMLQACVRDKQWLYVSLTLAGLTDALDRVKTVVEAKL